MIKTNCCNLEFSGKNHNPIYNGVCRNCGHVTREGLGLKEKLEQLKSELKKEREEKKKIVEYLEEFIEFCKCGNPVDDCICAE